MTNSKNISDVVLNHIKKHVDVYFFVIITVLSLYVRWQGIEFISGDMNGCLKVWFDEISANGGLKALGKQTGDYAILYQTFIAFCTYLNKSSVVLFKLFSIFFDYLLAFAAGLIADDNPKLLDKKGYKFYVVYAMVIFLPTVILNSSYWGQCDSIYTAFLLLTIYFLNRDKKVTAMIMYGLAFSFKLQSVFLLPYLIYKLFTDDEPNLLLCLIPVAVFWASGIFGYIEGRGLLDNFGIYLLQGQAGHNIMYGDLASYWGMVQADHHLYDIAPYFSIVILGIVLFVVIKNKEVFKRNEFKFAVWVAWLLVILLPSMHERYAYLVDILLIIQCIKEFNLIHVLCAFFSTSFSLMTYIDYLFKNAVWISADYRYVVYSTLFVVFTYEIFFKKVKDI